MIAAPIPVVVRAEIDNTPQADIGFDAPHIQVFEIAASVRVGLEIYTVTATVYLAVLNIFRTPPDISLPTVMAQRAK